MEAEEWKLTITRGLPCSGKSTWAEKVRAEHPTKVRVVTMDDIRAAIGASFEQGDEYIVQSIRDFTIRNYLVKGYHVISADTNLPGRTFRRVESIAQGLNAGAGVDGIPIIDVVVQDFRDVDLQTCLDRNLYRRATGDFKVPDEAIIQMYERFIKNQSR